LCFASLAKEDFEKELDGYNILKRPNLDFAGTLTTKCGKPRKYILINRFPFKGKVKQKSFER